MASKKLNDGQNLKYNLSEEKMDELIASLIHNNFNISKACTEVGVVREAYYYMLRWNEKFAEKMTWSKSFIGNLVTNGILEGITHQDLTLRHKYLDLLAKSGILAKYLGFEEDQREITLQFDKSQIQLG